jgi:hypothetical protein
MAPFLFRCPRTGQKVQGFTTEAAMERNELVQVVCHACAGVHFINPKREATRDEK